MTDRCVNCSRTKDQHLGENLDCPGSSKTRYGTMNLPAGRTCNDCAHFRTHCSWLLSRNGTETDCDWFPIRFVSLPGIHALLNDTEIPKGGSDGSL